MKPHSSGGTVWNLLTVIQAVQKSLLKQSAVNDLFLFIKV